MKPPKYKYIFIRYDTDGGIQEINDFDNLKEAKKEFSEGIEDAKAQVHDMGEVIDGYLKYELLRYKLDKVVRGKDFSKYTFA